MNQFYRLLFFILFLSIFSSVDATVSASISGSASVCQNDPNPVITFTGLGGTAPYTFTYQINGGSNLTSTTVFGSSITVAAPTSIVGGFVYSLVNVKDASSPTVAQGGSATVTVNGLPDITLNSTISPSIVNGLQGFSFCDGAGVKTFANGSLPATKLTNTNYTIDWGDGSPVYSVTSWNSTTHTYSMGLYTLTYTITGQGGCIVPKQYQIFISSTPNVSFGSNNTTKDICVGSDYSFIISNTLANPTGTVYTLSYSDGTPPIIFNRNLPDTIVTHTFNLSSCGYTCVTASGTYVNSFSATIKASNSCGENAVTAGPIYVSTPPVAKFTMPAVACANVPTLVTDISTGFEVTSAAPNCKTPTLVWRISPSIGVTLSSGTLGNDNGSTLPNIWSPGSTTLNPVFSLPGTYKISLLAGNRCGTDTISKTIVVEPSLLPQFTLSNNAGCAPLSVSTTNNIDLVANPSVTYHWSVTYNPSTWGTTSSYSYTGGTDSTSLNPALKFTNPGIYALTLTVINSCGTFNLSKPITVQKPPVISINALANICGPQAINPTAAINNGGAIAAMTYAWTFPSGTPATSNLANPGAISYAAAGNYTVSLSVTNECGTVSDSKSFTINPIPTVNAIPDQFKCKGTASTAIAFTGAVAGTTYSWTNNNISIGLAATGTGNIASFTTKNTTTTIQSATITVTPKVTATGCVGTPISFNITVYPTATVNAMSNYTFCNGDTFAGVTLGSPEAGTTFSWTNNTPSIGLAANGIGDIPSFSTANLGNTPIIATITIQPSINGCIGTSKAFTISVNPTPVVNPPTAQIICNGQQSTLQNLTGNVAGAVYNWTNDTPSIGLAATGSQNIPVFTAINSGTTPVTATITITPSANGCSGLQKTFTITVNPTPSVIFFTGNQIVCSGSQTSIVDLASNIAGATLNWTAIVPTGITGMTTSGTNQIPIQTLTNTTFNPIVVTYLVTADSNLGISCKGTASYTITVNPIPTITALQKDTTCSGVSISFIPANGNGNIVPPGTMYTWTLPVISPIGALTGATSQAIPNASVSQTLTNTTDQVATATYTVTLILGNCTANTFNLEVTVNPKSTVLFSKPNQLICSGNATLPVTLSSTTVGSVSYNWIANVPAGITGASLIGTNTIPAQTLINTTTVPLSVIYTSTSTINSGSACVGTSSDYTITVNPLPIISPIINVILCNNEKSTKIGFGSDLSGTTYSWTNDTPSIGLAASGNDSLPIFTGRNSGNVPVIATITVTPRANGCDGIPTAFSITVNPTPTVDQLQNQQVCNGFLTTDEIFSGNIVSADYTWINNNPSIGLVASGTGNIAPFIGMNSDTIPHTATITVTPSSKGCTGLSKSFIFKVNPTPVFVSQPVSSTVCQNGIPNILSVSCKYGIGTPAYQWYSNSVNAFSGTKITGATTENYTPSTTTIGNTYYYCIISYPDGGCFDLTSNMAIVTVNQLPTITTQPKPMQSICIGGAITAPLSVAFVGGLGAATYQWFSNNINANTGGTVIVGAKNSSYIPPVFSSTGNYYFYVEISMSGTGCGSAVSSVAEIDVVPDPVINVQPILSQVVCRDATPSDLTVHASGGVGTFAYQWYNNSANNSTGGNPIVGATNQTYSPPSSSIGTNYYYCELTQLNGPGCKVISETAEVIVQPGPSITGQPESSTICQNGIATLMSVTYINGSGTPSYQWYSNNVDNTATGVPIVGATNQTYNPPTSIVGSTYYYCTITLPIIGCSVMTSSTATVMVNSLPVISNQPKLTQSICIGGTILSPLKVAFTGGFGIGSIQWYSNTVNSTAGGTLLSGETNSTYLPTAFTASGKYYYFAVVTMTGPGCGSVTSDVAEIVVVPDPIVSMQPLPTQEICQNAVPTDLSVIATGGVGTFLYQWYSNTTNNSTGGTLISGANKQSYTPSTSTVGIRWYYCEVTQQNGPGCNVTSDIAQVTVNINPKITTQPIVSQLVCQFSTSTDLSVAYQDGAGTPTYQWYSYTVKNTPGIVIPGANSAIYNPSTAKLGTTYYYCVITFPAGGGCSVLTSDIAQVTTRVSASISNFNQVICSGGTFMIKPVNANGNSVPTGTTYTWSAPDINPSGSITGAAEQLIYQTEISQTLVNTTTSEATATYTVTPTNGNCDGKPFLVVIKVTPLINPNVVITNNTCANGNNASIQTNITGGIPPYTILWSGPTGFTANTPTISGLVSGHYDLTITENGGCPFTGSYTITEPAKIQITTNLKKDISCFGTSNGDIAITVNGGIPPYNVVWTKNSTFFGTNEDISNLSPGTYVVSVTDANNCGPVTATYTVNEPVELVINFTKQEVKCFGDNTGSVTIHVTGGTTTELTPGVFGYLYKWSGPNGFTSTNQNLQNLIAGTYNLIVTDKNNCTKTFSTTITQPAELIATSDTKQISCNGTNDATITVVASGGTPPYRIVWSNFAIGWTQNNLSAGDYTAIVLDANDCQKTLKMTISEPHIYSINPVVKNISCYGAHNGSINLNFQGGLPPISIKWSDSSIAGSVRNNLGPGTYIVTISDASPCVLTQSFVVIEPQQLGITANIKDALDCDNPNSGAISLVVSNGTQPYSYLWSNGLTAKDITNVGEGDYSVTVTDAGGCSKTSLFTVKRQQPISIEIATGPNYNCATKQVDMVCKADIRGGVPPYKTYWSSGTVSSENNQIMVTNQVGIVVLNVIDSKGCSSNYSFNVTIPKYGITHQLVSCATYSFQFNVDLPTLQLNNTYLWDFGDGSTSSSRIAQHSFPSSGSYKVKLAIVTTSCTINYEDIIIVEKEPVLVLDKLPKFCEGDSVVVHVSGANSYIWNAGSQSDSLTISREGTYTVTGVSKTGCTTTMKFNASYFDLYNYNIETDQSQVVFEGTPLKIWSKDVPLSQYFWDFGDGTKESGNDLTHVYSPSNAGFFDIKLQVVNPNGCLEKTSMRIWVASPALANTFSPNGDGKNDVFMKDWHIKVYNRNGILISDGFGWDGNYKGKQVANDTYFFVLYYSTDSGMKAKSGYVTLIR